MCNCSIEEVACLRVYNAFRFTCSSRCVDDEQWIFTVHFFQWASGFCLCHFLHIFDTSDLCPRQHSQTYVSCTLTSSSDRSLSCVNVASFGVLWATRTTSTSVSSTALSTTAFRGRQCPPAILSLAVITTFAFARFTNIVHFNFGIIQTMT